MRFAALNHMLMNGFLFSQALGMSPSWVTEWRCFTGTRRGKWHAVRSDEARNATDKGS